MSKRVSAIVPTYNRRARLEKVLAALDTQLSVDELQVVVVNDGSTDDTQRWLTAQSYRFELVAIEQRNSGPAVARNTGIDAATGEWLLFLDDDVVPTPTLVQEHLRSHQETTDLAVMGPLCSLPHYDQPWIAWEQARLEEQYAAMERGDWPPTFRQFWTGNASVARSHVLEVGKFDPEYLRGEDVELALRMAERGVRFRFNPRARGFHHAERSFESWLNAHRSYGELEARMLLARGEQAHLHMLAGNWSRVHRLTRAVTRQCVSNPVRFAIATRLLARCAQLSQPRAVVDKSLSGLANVLYWQACARALGPERIQQVFARGDEMRQKERTGGRDE